MIALFLICFCAGLAVGCGLTLAWVERKLQAERKLQEEVREWRRTHDD